MSETKTVYKIRVVHRGFFRDFRYTVDGEYESLDEATKHAEWWAAKDYARVEIIPYTFNPESRKAAIDSKIVVVDK